ncbi:class I SAM-dependent methyltransferase [Streptomyces sp. NBC_01016]|uniref:class I SAM-dependent methyltransferase n=1 Tax=Streptomyces sp. NBC_01016 TaxID=2903720 RepID=UPI002253DDC1|nr:class I SAM-dependent methyltransferase [Streptomyces sp. NBC_01016]MCX4834058.1 class I SAM-dependent methyltransferase [Streptomyces sp. NBC_01016]
MDKASLVGKAARRGGRDAVRHPVFARYYAQVVERVEPVMAPIRRELVAGLSGRVLEIGAGTGIGFGHYPTTVSEVVAIEPERSLRRIAVDAAQRVDVPVDVVPGAAEALPVKSEAYDAVVLSTVLCSVRNVERSLGEVWRVLRPGGEVRFFEHVRAPGCGMRLVQGALDRTLWPLCVGGCHLRRDAIGSLRAAGFELGDHRALTMPGHGPRQPMSYCVLGTARRPARDGDQA